jgi:hypothetical protein
MTPDREEEYRAILARNNLPPPPGERVVGMRYNMGRDDWYVETESGWFWLDRRDPAEWKFCPLGPNL